MVVSVTRRNERTDNIYKKIAARNITCGDMARWKGLEPLTYWVVASHSIQLSYKRNYEI